MRCGIKRIAIDFMPYVRDFEETSGFLSIGPDKKLLSPDIYEIDDSCAFVCRTTGGVDIDCISDAVGD
jgi:hypothetical protein